MLGCCSAAKMKMPLSCMKSIEGLVLPDQQARCSRASVARRILTEQDYLKYSEDLDFPIEF